MSSPKPSNPFRRDPDAPTLKGRGAALKVGIARAKATRPAALPAPAITPETIAEPASAVDPLVADIIACWREDAAIPEANREDGDPLYERWYARREALLDAAEALPATRDSLFAKALALAWLEYAQLWTRGQERADYATDGRLALDINAAVMGDLATAWEA